MSTTTAIVDTSLHQQQQQQQDDPRFPSNAIPATLWSIICPTTVDLHPVPYSDDDILKVLIFVNQTGSLNEININPFGTVPAVAYDPPETEKTPGIERGTVIEIFGTASAFINQDYNNLTHRLVFAADCLSGQEKKAHDFGVVNALLFKHFFAAQQYFLSDWKLPLDPHYYAMCITCEEFVTTSTDQRCMWCGRVRDRQKSSLFCSCSINCRNCCSRSHRSVGPYLSAREQYLVGGLCPQCLKLDNHPNNYCEQCKAPANSSIPGVCTQCSPFLQYCPAPGCNDASAYVPTTPQGIRFVALMKAMCHYDLNFGRCTNKSAGTIFPALAIISSVSDDSLHVCIINYKPDLARVDVNAQALLPFQIKVTKSSRPASSIVLPQVGSICLVFYTQHDRCSAYINHIEVVGADLLSTQDHSGSTQVFSPSLLGDYDNPPTYPLELKSTINNIFNAHINYQHKHRKHQEQYHKDKFLTTLPSTQHITPFLPMDLTVYSNAKELFVAAENNNNNNNNNKNKNKKKRDDRELRFAMFNTFFTDYILFPRQMIEGYIAALTANGNDNGNDHGELHHERTSSSDNNNNSNNHAQKEEHTYQLLSPQEAAEIIAVLDNFHAQLRDLAAVTPHLPGGPRGMLVEQQDHDAINQHKQQQYKAVLFEYQQYCSTTISTLSALAAIAAPQEGKENHQEENREEEKANFSTATTTTTTATTTTTTPMPSINTTSLQAVTLQPHAHDLHIKYNMYLSKSITQRQMQRRYLATTSNMAISHLLATTTPQKQQQPFSTLLNLHNTLQHQLSSLAQEDDGADNRGGDERDAMHVINALRQQLATKDQQLEVAHQQLTTKDQQLATKDKQLGKKDEQLEAKDQQLREKDVLLAHIISNINQND